MSERKRKTEETAPLTIACAQTFKLLSLFNKLSKFTVCTQAKMIKKISKVEQILLQTLHFIDGHSEHVKQLSVSSVYSKQC